MILTNMHKYATIVISQSKKHKRKTGTTMPRTLESNKPSYDRRQDHGTRGHKEGWRSDVTRDNKNYLHPATDAIVARDGRNDFASQLAEYQGTVTPDSTTNESGDIKDDSSTQLNTEGSYTTGEFTVSGRANAHTASVKQLAELAVDKGYAPSEAYATRKIVGRTRTRGGVPVRIR